MSTDFTIGGLGLALLVLDQISMRRRRRKWIKDG
jgi:hypothetical protein